MSDDKKDDIFSAFSNLFGKFAEACSSDNADFFDTAVKKQAEMTKKYYDELIKQGFTEEQALHIVSSSKNKR